MKKHASRPMVKLNQFDRDMVTLWLFRATHNDTPKTNESREIDMKVALMHVAAGMEWTAGREWYMTLCEHSKDEAEGFADRLKEKYDIDVRVAECPYNIEPAPGEAAAIIRFIAENMEKTI